MKTIEIPKPCHENWHAMTPTEQGAFCGSCQINVVDFSRKSNEEVVAILQENTGKHLCGRFAKSQLFEINSQFHVWEHRDPRVFQSKFLLACLLAFGLTLFTGCIEDEEIMGDVASENRVENVNPVDENSDGWDDMIIGDTIITDYVPCENPIESLESLVMGQAMINPYREPSWETTVSPSFEENRFVKGEIAVVQEIIDSPKVEIIAIPDVEKMVMGKMKYVPTEDIPIEEETLAEMVKEDTAIVKTSNLGTVEMDKGKNVILSRDIHANLFPNPTADHLEIVLTVPENIRAEITLISLSGDVLAEIYEGELPIGEMRFNLNLSDYATGTYIVAIQASGFRKYVKVQKIG